jgi:hypothetical protein
MLELSKLYKTAGVCGAALLMVGAGLSARQPQTSVPMSNTTRTTSSHGPVKQCSDIDVSFDHGARVAHAEQTITIPRASAPVLRAHLSGSSGLSIYTGTGSDYSVTVCKFAAATYGSSSNENLDAINVTVQNGEIHAKVPYENNWLLHLIVQAPAGAEFDVSTHNGPLELYDLAGKITARVENGPLSIDHCTGEVDGSSVNGPLSIKGSSGRMHVRTDNGPLSVQLEGNQWNNGALEGTTHNGPLSLGVETGYLSGVLLQTDGYSPMSCRAAACSDAQRTWDDNSRRIEIGKQPVVIHLSTHNGPVSVHSKTSSEDEI